MIALFVTALAAACALILYARGTPSPQKDALGRVMGPYGGARWKNSVAIFLASLGKRRESKKRRVPAAFEGFHEPEASQWWNESYYFNGEDRHTGNRVLARMARRGSSGALSFVFLCVHLDGTSYAVERDSIPTAMTNNTLKCVGLSFECEAPLSVWRLTYDGPVTSQSGSQVAVSMQITFTARTPDYVYGRDEDARLLGTNLASDRWSRAFFSAVSQRSRVSRCHMEQYGEFEGSITLDGTTTTTLGGGMFRDHSWDLRHWAAMDVLFILLITLDEPIELWSEERKQFEWFSYLNITLVTLPGNSQGLQSFCTGYFAGSQGFVGLTKVTHPDALNVGRDARTGERIPPSTETVSVLTSGGERLDLLTGLACDNPRRLTYCPEGLFRVYEDADVVDIVFTEQPNRAVVRGRGTRQYGFRIGTN